MKITVIHGQSHKGITYTMTNTVLRYLITREDEIKEFFLPGDGPGFCCGCTNCFLKGEQFCPAADKTQPIALAMEWADIIILDSPNYVAEMSGAMKNLMDHLAYRWFTHRPHPSMFSKVGLTVVSSAGAPSGGVARSMAKQLHWMGVPKTYTFALAAQAIGPHDLKPKKKEYIDKQAVRLAKALRHRASHPRPGIRSKFLFSMFKGMQSGSASWNPTDRNWWADQGWLTGTRPW